VHAGGDFTRDTSGARVGGSAFKKGSIPRAVDMPRLSCDHRALSPFGSPDGVRRCSLEGSASRSSLLATSLSKSVHSWWWCHRSCLLPAAVGGVQPHRGWHPSTTVRLQGFSSRSPVAIPRRRSPRRMTTSLMAGRSMPGYGLSPTLSIKDVHHPRCGGRQVEPGPTLRLGWRPASSSSIRGEGCSPILREGRTFATRGRPTAGCQLQRVWPFGAGWLWCRLRRCLLSSRHTGGPYKTSYATAMAAVFLDGLVLTPVGRNRSENPFVRAEAAAAHRCRGGRRRW
jgi:hypothetical protein